MRTYNVPYEKISYQGVIIGVAVRRSIAGTTTYRVRRGNGFYGSLVGEYIQDKFALVVPSSINNIQSEPYRAQWKAAVHHWKYALSTVEKKEYNRRATSGLQMSGYNLFMREAMLGKVEMYVDRGDPANYDFEIGDFTQDNAWHTLSLAALIPLSAKAVLLDADFNNNTANRHIALRKNGQTYEKNHSEVHTRIAAQDDHALMVVSPDGNRLIEYKVATAGWQTIAMTVRGWWI